MLTTVSAFLTHELGPYRAIQPREKESQDLPIHPTSKASCLALLSLPLRITTRPNSTLKCFLRVGQESTYPHTSIVDAITLRPPRTHLLGSNELYS